MMLTYVNKHNKQSKIYKAPLMGLFLLLKRFIYFAWKIFLDLDNQSIIYSYNPIIMKISVVCWSRANDKWLLLRFLQSLENQTFTDFDVNIICDRKFTKSEESDFIAFFENQDLKIVKRTHFFTNNNSVFNPDHGWWASYVRNFWIRYAKGEFIQLFDDDNEVDAYFLENCLKNIDSIHSHLKNNL